MLTQWRVDSRIIVVRLHHIAQRRAIMQGRGPRSSCGRKGRGFCVQKERIQAGLEEMFGLIILDATVEPKTRQDLSNLLNEILGRIKPGNRGMSTSAQAVDKKGSENKSPVVLKLAQEIQERVDDPKNGLSSVDKGAIKDVLGKVRRAYGKEAA